MDRDLGMDRPITRRDFLDGVAVGVGALTLGGFLQACDLGGNDGGRRVRVVRRPEDVTGLRGLTDRSFEVPHMLRDGTFWDSAPEPADTGERYDLVVVGAVEKDRADHILGEDLQQQALPLGRRAVDQDAALFELRSRLAMALHPLVDQLVISVGVSWNGMPRERRMSTAW